MKIRLITSNHLDREQSKKKKITNKTNNKEVNPQEEILTKIECVEVVQIISQEEEEEDQIEKEVVKTVNLKKSQRQKKISTEN